MLPALLHILAACAGTAEEAAATAPSEPVALGPQRSQEELARDPSAMRVSGAVTCPDAPDGWRVEVYAIPLGDSSRLPDALPDAAPLTDAAVGEDGAFSMWVPRGARRLLVGRHPSGAIAWGDPYGRYTEVVTEVVALGLDCRLQPVAALDGSRMASQGERIVPVVAFEPPPEQAESQAIVASVSAAPKIEAWKRAPEDIGGQETHDRIRARYRGRLTEEELDLMMPMLYQLSDQPAQADRLVDQLVSQRGASASRPRSPGLPEIR